MKILLLLNSCWREISFLRWPQEFRCCWKSRRHKTKGTRTENRPVKRRVTHGCFSWLYAYCCTELRLRSGLWGSRGWPVSNKSRIHKSKLNYEQIHPSSEEANFLSLLSSFVSASPSWAIWLTECGGDIVWL